METGGFKYKYFLPLGVVQRMSTHLTSEDSVTSGFTFLPHMI